MLSHQYYYYYFFVGSSARSTAASQPSQTERTANSLRLDGRTIHFSINAWVCHYIPSPLEINCDMYDLVPVGENASYYVMIFYPYYLFHFCNYHSLYSGLGISLIFFESQPLTYIYDHEIPLVELCDP